MANQRPNRELVVLALGLIGGSTENVHTEDIALKCHELFPDSFSWVKHTHLPDKDVVRVALTDARKERYGALVEGRVGRRKDEPDGWKLTDAGKDWFKEHAVELMSLGGATELKQHRQKNLKRLRRTTDHELFSRYSEDPDVFSPQLGEMAEMLRCRVDAEAAIWFGRFDSARRIAQSVERDDVVDFLERCQAVYERDRHI